MIERNVTLHMDEEVAVVTLNRPAKRNAIDEATLTALDAVFSALPREAKAVVLTGAGPHVCAGLDLKEHHDKERTAVDFMRVCQRWHSTFDKIQYGGIPVVAALHGAVVGGGLELAAATRTCVADPSTYFALPEGQKGIFTGGGATVRVARIITPGAAISCARPSVLPARASSTRPVSIISTMRPGVMMRATRTVAPPPARACAPRWCWPSAWRRTRRCRTTRWSRPSAASPTCRPPTACSPSR